MRVRLSGLSFTANLMVRSAIYAAIIVIIQWFQLGEMIAGLPLEVSSRTFWYGFIFSALISVVINLVRGITNIIGPRAFLNFIAGRGRRKPLRAFRRYRGVDRIGRAARWDRHSRPSRSHVSPAHPCGRGLSR